YFLKSVKGKHKVGDAYLLLAQNYYFVYKDLKKARFYANEAMKYLSNKSRVHEFFYYLEDPEKRSQILKK
ncbi:MAG: hypothetical protein GY870_01015, partial [archaeon]|nr:hypothetical protein [archaeon]